MKSSVWFVWVKKLCNVSETSLWKNSKTSCQKWIQINCTLTGIVEICSLIHSQLKFSLCLSYLNHISNACCESIFATFRRKEKENYHFGSLMVRAVAVFNKTVDWLIHHPSKSSLISQALRFVSFLIQYFINFQN